MSAGTEPPAIEAGRNLLPWDGDRGPGQWPTAVAVDQPPRHRHGRSAAHGTSVVIRAGVAVCTLGVVLGSVVVLGNHRSGNETGPSVTNVGSMNGELRPTAPSGPMPPAAVSASDLTSFGEVRPAAGPSATPTTARTVQPISASSPDAAPVTPTRSSVATPAITTWSQSTPSAESSCYPHQGRGHKAGC